MMVVTVLLALMVVLMMAVLLEVVQSLVKAVNLIGLHMVLSAVIQHGMSLV